VPRKLAHECAIGTGLDGDALDASEIPVRIGGVLVIGEARNAFAQDSARFGGKACPLSPLFRGERARVRGRS